jgi:S-adenosylmethionine decarboxylase
MLANMIAFATLRKMFFEGSEKKFELISRGAGFRQRPESFYQALVEMAGAKILSKTSSAQLDAYLLSESSLFVAEDSVTMLTCGRTTLARSADFLIDHVTPEKVDFFSYERKNEYFPHRQETDFYSDVKQLERRLKGRAFRFGFSDEHHLMLFHLDRPFTPRARDCTLEILMYNVLVPTCERSQLDRIFPGFQIDEHHFEPCGYSLNAVNGEEYYTLHVTPEDDSSYVSFESNMQVNDRINAIVHQVVEMFRPRSFDIIYFHPEQSLRALDISPFTRSNYVRESLSCGFEVGFATYIRLSPEARPADPLGASTHE